MTGFPVKRAFRSISALALAGVFAAPALAQTSPAPAAVGESAAPAPQLLAPQLLAPQLLAPRLLAPRQLTGVTPVETEPETGAVDAPEAAVRVLRGAPGAGAVRLGDLATVDPESIGVLDEADGGLGGDIWLGTERAYVAAMLPRLPVGTRSPVLRDLMQRLLLSRARAPAAAEGTQTDTQTDQGGLIARRVTALTDMGDLQGVDRLLSVVPPEVDDPALYRAEAEARFLADDNARACKLAAERIQVSREPFWQKALIFCQLLAGEPGKAELGLQLMEETGGVEPLFGALINGLLGGGAPDVKGLSISSGLDLAVARAANAELPAEILSDERPGVLRAIAVNPTAAVEIRLEAAERAEAAGALPAKRLREVYESVEFEADDLSRPLSRAEELGGVMGRALLYQAAVRRKLDTAKAEIADKALELGTKEGRLASVSRVFLDVIEGVPPSATFDWFAPAAIRALLSSGRAEAARSWMGLLISSALFVEESKEALVRLTPLTALSGGLGLEGEPGDLDAWRALVAAESDAAERDVLLGALLAALSNDPAAPSDIRLGGGGAPHDMPGAGVMLRYRAAVDALMRARIGAQAMIAEGGPEPETPLIDREAEARVATLVAAVGEGLRGGASGETDESPPAAPLPHRGEIVLGALVMMGPEGPGQAHASVIADAVRGLREAGYEEEARALALEAALARGL